MKMEEKLQETVEYYNNVLREIGQTEERLQQLTDTKQQLVGRLQTYQELIKEEQAPTNGGEVLQGEVVDHPSV